MCLWFHISNTTWQYGMTRPQWVNYLSYKTLLQANPFSVSASGASKRNNKEICLLWIGNAKKDTVNHWVIFRVKLTFELLTVLRQQHSISTHERMFVWKCRRFRDRKCLDLRGTRTPIFGLMPNALTTWAIRVRQLLSHVFEYWLWQM